MRTVASAITTAQVQTVAAPRHAAVAWPEVLSFASFASYATSGLETEVPATFAMRSTGDLAYVSYRFGYRSLVKVIDTTAAADWALTDTSATALFGTNAVRTMRACVFTDLSGDSWVYTADASGSAIQIKRAQLTGTTNPLTISLSNYGGTFGEALTDTSTLVRRVEAVCPTDNGVIVAVGSHRFDIDLSTIEFYWYPGSGSVLQLNTLIQFPLTAAYSDYSSEWWTVTKYITSIHAIYNATTKAICVYANDQVRGRSVMFTIKNGVESSLRPVVPIEAEATALSFLASSVSKIGSLYYLAGHWQRMNYQDGVAAQATAFDCYLTSADGEWWSFGERSFYLQSSQSNGALLDEAGYAVACVLRRERIGAPGAGDARPVCLCVHHHPGRSDPVLGSRRGDGQRGPARLGPGQHPAGRRVRRAGCPCAGQARRSSQAPDRLPDGQRRRPGRFRRVLGRRDDGLIRRDRHRRRHPFAGGTTARNASSTPICWSRRR